MAIVNAQKLRTTVTTQQTVSQTRNCSTGNWSSTSVTNTKDSLQYTHTYKNDTEYATKVENHIRLPYLPRTLTVTNTAEWRGFEHRWSCGPSGGTLSGITTGRVVPQLLTGGVIFLNVSSLELTQATGVAATQCRLNAAQAKVNLAQVYAERLQTANLLASTARRFASAIRSLRQGNVSGALRSLGQRGPRKPLTTRDIAGQWLEIQYGWKPLLYDLYGIAEALKPSTGRLLYQAIGRGRFSKETHTTSSGNTTTTTESRVDHKTVNIRAKCFMDVTVNDAALLQAMQLGLTNPLTLAWELTPWSFVVDWFLPISDYLEGLTALQGLSYLGGCTSTIRDFVARDVLTVKQRTSFGRTASSERPSWKTVVTRVDNVSAPGPSLSFKNPFSVTHVLNAMALLRQAVRG
jgi:hypothetical protein